MFYLDDRFKVSRRWTTFFLKQGFSFIIRVNLVRKRIVALYSSYLVVASKMMVLNSVYGMMNPEYRSYSKNVVDAVVVIISRYQVHMVFPADCINIIQFHKSYAQSHVLWCLFVCFD